MVASRAERRDHEWDAAGSCGEHSAASSAQPRGQKLYGRACLIRARPAHDIPLPPDFGFDRELEAEPTKGIGQRFGFKH